ncbi:hypothetical protein KCV00_g275, partial [Aureobasidium melanogenum]
MSADDRISTVSRCIVGRWGCGHHQLVDVKSHKLLRRPERIWPCQQPKGFFREIKQEPPEMCSILLGIHPSVDSKTPNFVKLVLAGCTTKAI